MPLPTEYDDQRLTPRYAPFIKPVPIPTAQAFDEPTRCLRVNEQWVGYILGALDVLDQFDVWEGGEEQVFNARQQVLQIKAALMDTEACEQMPALEIEVVDCQIRYRTNPADDWTIAPGTLDGCGGSSEPSGGGCLPVGSVFPSMAGTTPANCLPCTGGQYLKADYPELWAVIVPGSDFDIDADNFAVPDMRGRFALGAIGVPGFGYSETGGETTHVLTINEIPSHTHNFSSGTATGTGAYPVRGNSTLSTPNHVTASAGSGEAHNNMPPYVGLNWYVVAQPCPEGTDGVDGEDGASILMDVIDGWIVWRQDKPGSAWINLVPLSELRGLPGADGDDGANGLQGAPGPVGPQGPEGVPGEDGECGCDTPPSEAIDTEDRLKQLCAISRGLGKYLADEFVTTISAVDSAAEVGRDILDTATDLLDSIPIIGNVVDELIDFLTAVSEAGDFDDIANCANDADNRDLIYCALYCWFKQNAIGTELNASLVNDAIVHLKNTAYGWLPCPPFATLWGQFFGLWLATLNTNLLAQRAFVYADERSDDCLTLCTNCVDDPSCPEPCTDDIQPSINVTTQNPPDVVWGGSYPISSGGYVSIPDNGWVEITLPSQYCSHKAMYAIARSNPNAAITITTTNEDDITRNTNSDLSGVPGNGIPNTSYVIGFNETRPIKKIRVTANTTSGYVYLLAIRPYKCS